MISQLKLLVLLTALVSLCAETRGARFSPAASPTLGKRVAKADVVALAKIVKRTGKHAATLEIVEVTGGEMAVYKGARVEITTSSGIVDSLFLIYGKRSGAEIDWRGNVEVTRAAYRYAVESPPPDADEATRMRYWFRHLGSDDKQIASDVARELGGVDFETLRQLSSDLPRDGLRRAFRETAGKKMARCGLYAKLLGLCGDEGDAKSLVDLMMASDDAKHSGFDGVVSGYLMLTGEDGLELVEKAFLQTREIDFVTMYGSLLALNFMMDHGNGAIPRSRLRQAGRLLLDHPEMADLGINYLKRWGDWTVHERLITMFRQRDEYPEWIRVPITQYMLASQNVPPEARSHQPERVRLGKKYYWEIVTADAKTARRTHTFFLDGQFVDRTFVNEETKRDDKPVEALKRVGATVFERAGSVVEVNANRSMIGDDDLRIVAKFAALTDLSLEQTKIGDAGLAHLKKLDKLQWLNLYQTKVGDRGLEHLKELEALKLLPIGETQVTDKGLAHLSDMTQLEYLGLRANKVTDDGVAHLKKLTKLTALYLGETQISDACLQHLAGMNKLQRLWLNDTSISDAAIETLAKLTSLRELHIQGTKLTPDGLMRLQRMLPRCEIRSE